MVQLSPYQEVSRDYLKANTYACLFDAPGVGKTFPSIAAAWEKKTDAPILVTAPSYLFENWRTEIHRLYPQATVEFANGSGKAARTESLTSDADFIICGYSNWSAKDKGVYRYPVLLERKWSALLVDEVHRLRGYQRSSSTKHFIRLRLTNSVNKETPMYLLTGTPMVRDGSDFFIYFHLFDKKKYGSYWKFVNERCIVVETPFSKQIGNIKKSYASEFRAELAQFSLRRTTQEIPELASLEFVENNYYVDMPKSVITMIKQAKKEYVLEHEDLASPEFLNGSGALYVKQRQIATVPPTKLNPKVEWLKDFLTDKKGKTVVYTWFKDSARAVCDSLGDRATLITGDVGAAKRGLLVDKWRRPDGPDVLVCTIPSLKEGISLTESSDVVFLEHSELPADIEQCIKRLCRRGQGKLVQAHHVHAKGTVDMAIEKVLNGRAKGITEALAKWIAEDDVEETEDWFE